MRGAISMAAQRRELARIHGDLGRNRGGLAKSRDRNNGDASGQWPLLARGHCRTAGLEAMAIWALARCGTPHSAHLRTSRSSQVRLSRTLSMSCLHSLGGARAACRLAIPPPGIGRRQTSASSVALLHGARWPEALYPTCTASCTVSQAYLWHYCDGHRLSHRQRHARSPRLLTG